VDIISLYKNCRLCPRDCGVNRLTEPGDQALGYCGESSQLRLAFAGLHRGEEPPLSGEFGSGTIFVSGCNLGCAFCQNWQISTGLAGGKPSGESGKRLGRAVSADEFAAICLELQNKGAENINIVTGTHATPAIIRGLDAAKTGGLRIPVLWNSSGYESITALELLSGKIDVYLPDLKTLDEALAAQFFNAPDYPQAATQAIQWMIQAGNCRVMIRHLILPGCLESTRSVLRWFADNAQGKAAGNVSLSLMSQYTPIAESSPGRFVNQREYDTVLGWLSEFGIEDGFCQELVTGSDWLPDFTRPNPFSSELSVPVWHYAGRARSFTKM
jgi:putative pyruvate formate lyase activating enzyme